MREEDTTIRISREEKQALDAARNAWERRSGRRISAGEFVRFLAEQYLAEEPSDGSSRAYEPMGEEGAQLVAAQEVRPAEPQPVAPGPQVLLVTCIRCRGQIAWRTDLGVEGCCPYCGTFLRLVV
jgi:hypothetical protein